MRLNLLFAFALAAIFSNSAISQTVLTVGAEEVSLADFEHIYQKNNKDLSITSEALDEYMDLFIKFKLKVLEAENLGMDDDAEFIKELDGYRKQLARPYMIDNELLDEIVKEAYDRSLEEVRARHILVSAGPNVDPADSLRAWNRLNDLRNRVIAGEDFAKVATSKGGSDDPSARDNAGDLGWFTAFQMVHPFEEAAYNTPVGEVSEIVRTRFGFHFLEVTDRRPARGEVKVAHIMISVPDQKNKVMMESATKEVNAVYAFLQQGESFESLALKYSDDESSKSKGGVLPWFGTGKMVETFEEAAFSLKNDGDISEPVLTRYGWHIVKRLGFKPPASFEEVEKTLTKKVSRDSRAEVTKTSFLNKLKREYGFRVFEKRIDNLTAAAASIDSVFFPEHQLEVKSSERNKTLYMLDGKVITVQEFVDFANSKKIRMEGKNYRDVLQSLLAEFEENKLMSYEDSKLEEKYDDFRLLMEEYHDGILLFELTDEKVWSKAVKDTLGLQEYYTNNQSEFMWGTRLNMVAYTCENAEIAAQVKETLASGGNVDELRKQISADKPLAIKEEKGLFEFGSNNLADSVFDQLAGGLQFLSHTVLQVDAGGDAVAVISLKEVLKPTTKTLEESRGQVIASYQDYLEKAWVEELRAKYSVTINNDVLYQLVK